MEFILTQELIGSSYSDIPELFRNILIDYYLDNRLFDKIPPLLGQGWEDYVISSEPIIEIIKQSDFSKRFSLKILKNDSTKEETSELVDFLIENLDKVDFVSRAEGVSNCFELCQLDINRAKKVIEKSGKILILQQT